MCIYTHIYIYIYSLYIYSIYPNYIIFSIVGTLGPGSHRAQRWGGVPLRTILHQSATQTPCSIWELLFCMLTRKMMKRKFCRFLVKIIRFDRFYQLLASGSITVERRMLDLPGVKGQMGIIFCIMLMF